MYREILCVCVYIFGSVLVLLMVFDGNVCYSWIYRDGSSFDFFFWLVGDIYKLGKYKS